MKKIVSLILTTAIVLTSVINAIVVLANSNSITTYDIVRTESTTPDNLVGAASDVSISMSGNRISTGSYNGYKLSSNNWYKWRPAFFFLTESGGTKSKFMTKQNSKYIVEMEYIVESPRTDNHSLQVGLFGNIGANGQTESAIWLDKDANGNKLFKTHPQADNGKTINYTVAFTATSAHSVGLIFYGQGSITLNSIKIKEASAEYAIVTYIDGERKTYELAEKNSSPKVPQQNGSEFFGWYNNAEFTGNAVTSITDDITLYAKRNPVVSYDIVRTESTTPDNLVGAASDVSISMSGNRISTSSYNGYNLNANNWYKWRPAFFFLTESGGTKSKFMTKQNSKYIVEMEYVVESNRTDNHSIQVGLFGNIGANGQTESAIWLDKDANGNKLFKTHPAADNGKTINYTVAFTATSAHNVGLIFYGQGHITLNSIKIKEVSADYALVTYIDGDNKTYELAEKNSSVKTLQQDGIVFGGWYKNADFTGDAVTTITEDVTLYAKWIKNIIYDIVRTESTTPDNLVGAASDVSISMSGNRISTSSYNGYNLNSNNWYKWRPAFLFLTENGGTKSKFMTKKDSRYIVEMEYVVESNRTDNHSLQVGLFGNIGASGQTENAIWLDKDANGNKLFKTHPAADNGKTINYTVIFTATSAHNVGLIFYGQGHITLNSIKVKEASADCAVVTYIDDGDKSYEFVEKNTSPKIPEQEGCDFGGWYSNADFTGNAVTTVTDDITLYAKWDVAEGFTVIDFRNIGEDVTKKYSVGDNINFIPVKSGYNFLGWYKRADFYGRPVTVANGGRIKLYAKWEEKNPDVDLSVDLSKNDKMITTAKSSESKLTVSGSKINFDISNYERQLNSTDTSSSESWFPGYQLVDGNGKNVALEIGSTYELEVTYKIIDVKAGDNVGLQIGFGTDGQPNQTRTKIKGYAMHTAADKGKEFTYSTSYTAEKFYYGSQHLPKLIFSGQGELEVTSVKIKKILPVIKDTVIGVQNYEDYKADVESGVLGNKKGTEVSTTVNHTSGLFKKKALKLDLNTEYLRLSGNTVISIKKDGALKPYVAEKGGAYRITFYMYANQDMNNLHWSINSVDESKTKDYFTYFKMEKDGEISLKKDKWTEIVAYIPVLKGCESAKNLFAIAVASNGYDGKSVYIDDVKVEQLVDSEVIVYNSMGGSELEPQRAFADSSILSFKEPVKDGYFFDGWYYDAEYKKEAKTYDIFPSNKEEIELFAKWIEAPTTAYDFNAGSFDAEIYDNGVTPYENAVADMDAPFDGENHKGMTQNSVWVKDAGIYGNGTAETDGALAFSNELYSNYNDKRSYNVIRLVNKDGTPFTVVKGARYTIKFDYIFASAKGLSYIVPIISEHSAYSEMGKDTAQTIGRVSVMETDTDYLTYKQSFIAEKTGYVYLTLTGRDDNANVDTHCYEKVYVDNLEIKCNPNVVKLDIKQGNNLWYTKYGIKGEKLIMPNALKTGTDTFDGFYLDAEFTKKFDGFYPEKDTTIYIKVKTDKYDKPSDFSKPIVLDFEETELLNDFYRQQKYMTSWSRETSNEWIFVTDDEKNALNGKNYIKLNGFGHYWNQAKFALYDPNHAENVMLLDKGGKYRVTVMVRCEDLYETPVNMTICLENPSQQHLLAENGNVKLEYIPSGDKDGYFMFVGDIEVADDMKYYPSLAIRRNANDLQSIFIDTVMVEKLRDCTVKFEENGGSQVDDVVVQIHDPVFDPGIPYKEGFVFDGWYTDNKFTRKWDFDKDTVEGDMTLYAKWSVEIIKEETEDTDSFEPVFDDETEVVIDNGLAPTLLDADKVVIENQANDGTTDTQGGLSIWIIVLIIAGSVIVLGGATVLTIILIRKKRKI